MTRAESTADGEDQTVGRRDAGLSLIEVLVTMGLVGLLSTLLLGFAVSTSRVTQNVRSSANVTEESRLAVERWVASSARPGRWTPFSSQWAAAAPPP